jgi:hypothetical protein
MAAIAHFSFGGHARVPSHDFQEKKIKVWPFFCTWSFEGFV